jgi:hypothetical protein
MPRLLAISGLWQSLPIVADVSAAASLPLPKKG